VVALDVLSCLAVWKQLKARHIFSKITCEVDVTAVKRELRQCCKWSELLPQQLLLI